MRRDDQSGLKGRHVIISINVMLTVGLICKSAIHNYLDFSKLNFHKQFNSSKSLKI